MDSVINIRTDREVKERSEAILNDLGLSMSSAINIFLRQVISREGLPFEVRRYRPNTETREAIEEGYRLAADPGAKRYKDVKSLMEALGDDEDA